LDNPRSLAVFVLLILAALFYTDIAAWIRPPKTPALQPSAQRLSGSTKATPSMTASAPSGAAPPSPAAMASPATVGAQAEASAPAAAAALVGAGPATGPPRTIEIDTDLYQAIFTTKGTRLLSFRLKRYRQTVDSNSPPYDMVAPGERFPIGLVISREGELLGDQELGYATDAPARVEVRPGSDSIIKFTAQTREGLRIIKQFTFRDGSYLFELTAETTGATASLSAIGLTMSQPLTELSEGYRNYPMVQGEVKGKVYNEYEKGLKKGTPPVSGDIAFAGIGNTYFLSAFLPRSPSQGELKMEYDGGEARAVLLFPGAHALTSGVYMGPKALKVLEATDPRLRDAINFGWFGFLAIIFLRALQLLHTFIPNYGWDILLLTLAVRLATLPASIKAQRSALRMQRLQPQVEKIREKFKDDSTRLNREMMDLYKRNHVNPLGGCIPTVIQLPILYAIYEALQGAIELRQAPFAGWIRDLSAPDCFPVAWMPKIPGIECHGIPVLVLLMGASTFLQQWMMPKAGDPNQQKMMMWMPIFFTVLFVALPAGLSLYYFASNLLGIIQQFFLNREFKQYTPVATA
jgi:YidC/Oxa1 family membrane protein insertase